MTSSEPDTLAFKALIQLLSDTEAAVTTTGSPRALTDASDRTQWYRYALEVVSLGIDMYMHSEPTRPIFTPITSEVRKVEL